jgi:hypothetical protein
MKTRLLSPLLGLLLASAAFAEWRTESFVLKPGWNAIYPGVDASYTTLDQLLSAYPAILEIWRWQPERVDPRLPADVTRVPTGVEWSTWKRDLPEETTFTQLSANYGYLVRLADSSNQLTIPIKGRATLPEVRWRGDALHLAGFPVLTTGTTPTFSTYLAAGGFSLGSVPVLRYNGGPIANGTNPLTTVPTVTRIVRGQAYWIRTNQFSRYYGPLKVEVSAGDGIKFGDRGDSQSLLLTNVTSASLTFTVASAASDAAPAGQPFVQGAVPVQVKVDAETSFTPLSAARSITLEAGAIARVQVAVDRTGLTGAVGTHFASLLKLTTTAGVAGQEVYVPVTAEVGSVAGLWIGEAQITQVGSVALRYERDAAGNTVYGSDGKPRIIEDLTTPGSAGTLPSVDRSYPLRVMLHVNASGQATLLSHIYQGTLATAPPEAPVGLVRQESLLAPADLKNAVRLSVAHLPLDTALALGGGFAPGATLAGAPLVTAFDSAINPFVHLYHPDHDNLDARFASTLPAGRESFAIRRTISLKLDATAPSESGAEWGTSTMTGTYSEFIEGPYKTPIRAQGTFSLYKVSDISAITTP